jgi:hypothetical protein
VFCISIQSASLWCDNSSVPISSCFEWFEPKKLVEWNLRNWTNGCVRRFNLCEMLKIDGSSEVKQDGFFGET